MGSSNPGSSEQKESLTPEQLLARYEQLLGRSHRMLEWAKLGQWEDLLSEEVRYVEDVQRLASLEPSRELGPDQLQHRLDLMEKILECNLDVKRCLEARRDEIGELINLSRRQGELGRSYGVIDSIDKP